MTPSSSAGAPLGDAAAVASARLRALVLFSALLAAVLQIVGAAAPWGVATANVTATTTLTAVSAGGSTVAIPPSSAYGGFGLAALASLVLALVLGFVALALVGVSLQRSGGFGAIAGRAPPPDLAAHSHFRAGTIVAFAWVSFFFCIVGFGLGMFFIASLLNIAGQAAGAVGAGPLPSGITFPARDATAAALAFSLLSAVAATVHCRRGRRAGAESALTATPVSVTTVASSKCVGCARELARACNRTVVNRPPPLRFSAARLHPRPSRRSCPRRPSGSASTTGRAQSIQSGSSARRRARRRGSSHRAAS